MISGHDDARERGTTRVFLFTDVEGSTKLWVDHGERMGASLRRHDDIVRSAIEGCGGDVFATAGDSFGAAFARASDAIAAARSAQDALRAADWPGPELRVRMGIHQGRSEVRGGNHFGAAVNLTARVEAAGRGGQIVVTAPIADAHDGTVVALGAHRLAGFDEPVALFQLGDGSFPPLRSAGAMPSTLPATRGELIGRVDELAKVRRLLGESRIVTLTGVGGSGKTRLAVEAARQRLPRFPGGVFFVDLASVDLPSAIPQAVAVGLGTASTGGVEPLEAIARRADGAPTLLVLDNCEHLIDAVADLVDELVAHVPQITVLATSREALEIDGERTFRVPSLRGGVDGPAVALFLDRATAVQDRFDPDPDDVAHVAAICEQLDGMPLAIELAASRVRALPVAELRQRLEDRFALLSGGRRWSRQRQQTLEATIAWSHDLLEPDEQAMLRRLSVFHDGFDIVDVAGVTGFDEARAVDLVDALTAKSLVEPAQRRGVAGHRLLESIRLFALDRLAEAGEIAETRTRHLQHFASSAMPTLFVDDDRREQVPAPAEIERSGRESQNLAAASAWAAETGDLATLLRVVHRTNTFNWSTPTIEAIARAVADRDTMKVLSDDERLRLLAMVGVGLNQAPWLAADLGEEVLERLDAHLDGEWQRMLAGGSFVTLGSAWTHEWMLSTRLPRHAADLVTAFETHGQGAATPGTRWIAAMWSVLAVHFAEGVEAAARRCDELREERPPTHALGPMLRSIPLVYTYCLAGRTDDARQLLTADDGWPSPDVIGGAQIPIAWSVVHLAEEAGRGLAEALTRRAIPLAPGQPSAYLGMYAWIAHALGDTSRAEELIDLVTVRAPWDLLLCCHAKAAIAGWPADDFAARASDWRDERRAALVHDGEVRLRHMATVLDAEAARWAPG